MFVTVHGAILLGLGQFAGATRPLELWGWEPAWEQSWLISLDTAIRLPEVGQPCLQDTSCCCSQILSKFGCSVSLGPC